MRWRIAACASPRSAGHATRGGAALFQRQKNAFDMFAGAEAIDLMIRAAAGIREANEIADFHLIGAAAV
jgi:hypothetical protein